MKELARVLRDIVVATALLYAACAHAGMPTNSHWACWYAPSDLTVRCLLAHAAETGDETRRAEVDSRFDRRLPQLVRMIWGSPEELAGLRISIPLYSVPYDMEFVHQLAKSVMCGARKDCSVGFDTNRDGRAELRAAALETDATEEDVMAEMTAQGFHLAAWTPPEEEPVKKMKRRKGLFG